MNQNRKHKTPGRPRLPRGQAKGKIVPVRLDADDLKLVNAAAKRSKQILSEWIRQKLRTAAEVEMFKITLHDAIRTVLAEYPERTATTSAISEEISKRGLYERWDGEAARARQINARARQYPELFEFVEPGMVRLVSHSLTSEQSDSVA